MSVRFQYGQKPRTTEPDATLVFRLMGIDAGSSLGATQVEPIVFSSDVTSAPATSRSVPTERSPSPDWQNPIIGHMRNTASATPAETTTTAPSIA